MGMSRTGLTLKAFVCNNFPMERDLKDIIENVKQSKLKREFHL